LKTENKITLEDSIARVEESLFQAEQSGNGRAIKALKKTLEILKRRKKVKRAMK